MHMILGTASKSSQKYHALPIVKATLFLIIWYILWFIYHWQLTGWQLKFYNKFSLFSLFKFLQKIFVSKFVFIEVFPFYLTLQKGLIFERTKGIHINFRKVHIHFMFHNFPVNQGCKKPTCPKRTNKTRTKVGFIGLFKISDSFISYSAFFILDFIPCI